MNVLNQKGTRPHDHPTPLAQLPPEDQRLIFKRYPNLASSPDDCADPCGSHSCKALETNPLTSRPGPVPDPGRRPLRLGWETTHLNAHGRLANSLTR